MHAARQVSTWLLAGALAPIPALAQAASPVSARTWVGQAEAIEACLKTAEVIALEDVVAGVTKPMKATLAPGGPVEVFAWKDIKPGIYQGHWESYKAEVAAYKLDKLLELGMIPPNG